MRFLRWLFAGDTRVWKAAAIVGVPLLVLIAVWCLVPRDYFVGTESINDIGPVAQAPAGEPTCVPGLAVPAGTARIQMDLLSPTGFRPALSMRLRLGGRVIVSRLPAGGPTGSPYVDFLIPTTPSTPAAQPASFCIRTSAQVTWGGVTLIQSGFPPTPTVGGRAIYNARITVRYLPPAGAKRSYLDEAAAMFSRASLFRPGFVGPWLYVVIFFALLPALAVIAVRLIALALARERRHFGRWLFGICALNAMCWALITPVFHLPDEVDHFAYVANLATHFKIPESPSGGRWPSSEADAIAATRFNENHYTMDSRAPWLRSQVTAYNQFVARTHPSDGDGGGITTASSHGPIYYLALVPAFLLAGHDHVFSQVTLSRLVSALIGAITAVCVYLMCLEVTPRKRWLAVMAALLVSYQPMYGFISGGVNNDVGINAGAAAVELLLVRIITRGLSLRRALVLGVLLALLPYVKGTAYSIWAIAAIVLLFALVRELVARGPRDWLTRIGPFAAFGVTLLLVHQGASHATSSMSSGPSGPGLTAVGGILSGNPGLQHPTSFLSYLWQVLMPRLPFMTSHFINTGYPFKVIFVERGFAAFGFYSIYFPMAVYTLLTFLIYLTPIATATAAWRERVFVRRNVWTLLALLLIPVGVIVGFESQFYTYGARNFIPEFGRYAFPAIGPLAILVVVSLYAFGRRMVPWLGAGLVVAMIAFSYASQLLTLTSFFG